MTPIEETESYRIEVARELLANSQGYTLRLVSVSGDKPRYRLGLLKNGNGEL